MNIEWGALFSTYRDAYLAAAIIALGCSVLGVYVVLRRVAFVGIATAQVAAAGVAVAFLVNIAPLPAAVLSALIGISLFAVGRNPVRISRDGIIGVAFATASALAVLFVSRSAAELDQIEHIIYGSLLFATTDQVMILAIGIGAVLLVHLLFSREFLMVSFDHESAGTLGVRTRLFDLLLFLTLGVVIALSIGTAGSLLAFAFLILPPMTGLLLGNRMSTVFILSIAGGLLAAFLGVLVSILLDFPTGPSVVVAAGALFACALAASRHPFLGILTVGVLVAAVYVAASDRNAALLAAHDESGTSQSVSHVDLELAIHGDKVSHGDSFHVDYVVRIRGAVPRNLHLLINAGSAIGVARLTAVTSRSAGRIELDSSVLEPGEYVLTGSFWTGDPLDPDDETELLPPDVCSATELKVIVVQ